MAKEKKKPEKEKSKKGKEKPSKEAKAKKAPEKKSTKVKKEITKEAKDKKPATGEIAEEVNPEPGVPEAESTESGADDLCLKTDVDRLFHLVEKKGKLDIVKASRIFKVPEDKIEEWGRILEEHGLIELHYPPIGKPMLKKRTSKEEVKNNKEK